MYTRLISICAIAGGLAMPCWSVSAQDQQSAFRPKQADTAPAGDGVLDTSATGYMRVGHDPDFDLMGDFTIEVRASFEHFNGNQEIVRKTSAWDRDGFVLKWHGHRLQFIRGGRGGAISTSDTGAFTVTDVMLGDLKPNQMYDLAVVKKGPGVEFFVDGQAVGAGHIGPMVPTVADLMVSTPWAAGHLAGKVDELRIWRRAHDAEMMEANAGRQLDGREPDLLALYRFDDENNGKIVRNVSKPTHDGVLVGKAVLIRPKILPAMQPQ